MSFRPLASVACLLVLSGFAFAQTPLGNSALIELNYKKITKGSWKLKEYIEGKEPPTDAAVLDAAAKYFAYAWTWTSLHEAKTEPGKMDPFQLHAKDFADHIKAINFYREKGTNTAFIDKYMPVLVAHFKELTDLPVIENSKSLIHGLQALPVLARVPHDSVAKYLYSLVDEKSNAHDLVKLYAIRAIRELPGPKDPPANDNRVGIVDPWDSTVNPVLLTDKAKMARKALDLERVDVLSKFILRPMPSKKPEPGEEDAYRYLRREAIETLGQSGYPAVSAFLRGGKGEVEGPIAPVLLKVFTEKLEPPVHLHERVEAAMALCNMGPMQFYDPAPAQYFVGHTLVELGKHYSTDYAIIKAGEKGPERRPLPATFPWKVTAKKMEDLLKYQAQKDPGKGDKRAAALDAVGKAVTDNMLSYKDLNRQVVDLDVLVRDWKPAAEFRAFKAQIKSAPLTWSKE